MSSRKDAKTAKKTFRTNLPNVSRKDAKTAKEIFKIYLQE